VTDTTTTADAPTIVVALSAVMNDVQAVRKDSRNTQQNYPFRGIDAVMNAAGPALRRHGVVVVPNCERVEYRDVHTTSGKPSRECTVTVRFTFYGPAGDSISCVTPGESMDFGDKGAPKAMSVAFRIALLQALCLPTDEPDPDAASYERAAKPAASPSTPAKEARAALRTSCEKRGWNTSDVAARFATDHNGADLMACDDAKVIDEFRKRLIDEHDNGQGAQ
jgi:hypothetical protein